MTVIQPLILTFTDFGTDGPYLGQMEAAILDEALQSRVINLLSDAPSGDPRHSAYLLAALSRNMPPGCVVLGVVDPGVGSERRPIIVEAGGHTYVGPDNGLFSRVAATDPGARAWQIDWRPARLSDSFHGRDLFAPVAGNLSIGQDVDRSEIDPKGILGSEWPLELGEVIYVDRFGNAMTGLAASRERIGGKLRVGGRRLPYARTFSEVPDGETFWYANSNGLVELATNQGRATDLLNLKIGDPVFFD